MTTHLLRRFTLFLFVFLAAGGCEKVDSTAVVASDTPVADRDWPLHGRVNGEDRFSPLAQINTENVADVGLAWEVSMDSQRGLEATPIVVDGVMYITSTWSRVFAIDAKTGESLWEYDPEVPRDWAARGCCDVVNRGVAVADGRLFVGTFDGRLVALNKDDGSVLWSVNTIDRDKPYTITGAPRVTGNKVVIGNGGADFMVRGYFSAYDVESGEMSWRFYSVPANTTGPFEHEELAEAAKTWDPDSLWEMGGGGTAWDSMAYDPELNLLYVGTGNGAPWPAFQRSPSGGDNLYLSSILAINPDNGKLVWHYQTTPGDSWDYTATQHIILTELDWEGEQRKVLMQAPKNGFFYVLDRETGELLAANKFVRATWATHVDMETGRPVLTDTADYSDKSNIIFPSTLGGHNWHPMSYSPDTGLVYIPAQDAATYFSPDRISIVLDSMHRADMEKMSPDPWLGFAVLVAWNPVTRGIEWTAPYPTFGNAGVLSTAGNLVIQGDAQGYVNFYDAKSGDRLRRLATRTGIIAPPIAYEIDGEQYVAVLAGFGGALFVLTEQGMAAKKYRNDGRLLVFKLGGGEVPLAADLDNPPPPPAGEQIAMLSADETRGRTTYVTRCGACHGWFGQTGLMPDLRRLSPSTLDNLEAMIFDGPFQHKGMPSFTGQFSDEEVADLKAYLSAVSMN
jgi:quinohemoprotein ethanol dehydrogenase